MPKTTIGCSSSHMLWIFLEARPATTVARRPSSPRLRRPLPDRSKIPRRIFCKRVMTLSSRKWKRMIGSLEILWGLRRWTRCARMIATTSRTRRLRGLRWRRAPRQSDRLCKHTAMWRLIWTRYSVTSDSARRVCHRITTLRDELL